MESNVLLVLLGVSFTSLIAVIGWIGVRLVNQMDDVIKHLVVLNHRTEKLEARMTTQEDRIP